MDGCEGYYEINQRKRNDEYFHLYVELTHNIEYIEQKQTHRYTE